jgi:transcriptional regulator with XRE-family HTH domain
MKTYHLDSNDPILQAVADDVEIGRTAIEAARKFRNVSQEQLAVRAGTSVSTIQHIEEGGVAPDRVLLEALAEALQVPADLLVG